MGQPMPDVPIEYGNDCLARFPAGKTPKYLYARFSQVVRCDPHTPPVCHTPPNDVVFKLTQDAVSPCVFMYDQSGWIVTFYFAFDSPPVTYVQLQDALGYLYFSDFVPTPVDEGYVFHNDLTRCEAMECAHGGIAIVTWTDHATDILKAINMSKANDLFMEVFPTDDDKLVYKFCKLKDATNIKILFEP
ncbi:unnamed protein product, partial [marine sediment metagenome]